MKCFWVPVCPHILQRMKNATEFLRDNFAKNRVSSTIVNFFRHLCWLDSANVILMRQLVAWPKQSWKGVKVQIVLVLCCFGTHHSEHQAHQWQMPQKIFCSWLLLQLQIPVDWGCSYSWKEKQENKLPLKNLRNHHNHLFCSSQKLLLLFWKLLFRDMNHHKNGWHTLPNHWWSIVLYKHCMHRCVLFLF